MLDYQTLVQRAAHLRLSALSLAEGMRSGSFRSLYRGQGVEFAGVRDYYFGDDIRTIDWNVTARMNKPYVKMYNEERELIVYLIVDRSLSMQSGFSQKSRLQIASEIAALLIFAAQQNNSPVGAVFFDGQITLSCTPKMSHNHSMMLLKALDSTSDTIVAGSVLAQAIIAAHTRLKHRSLVVILSDFRTSDYEKQLALLGLRHDVLAIRITDISDTDLPKTGTLRFFDPETNDEIVATTDSADLQRQWAESHNERVDRWQNLCRKHKIIPLQLSTEDDPALILSQFFYSREKR